MNTVDTGDWTVYVALFVAGGFPWITQIKNLQIHFVYADKELQEIFNSFASLFSFSLFFFIKTTIVDQFAQIREYWWLLLFLALILVAAYLVIFLSYLTKGKIINLPGIIIAFIIYISIYCTLVSGFSLLYLEKDYFFIKGNVTGENNEGVDNAAILVLDEDETILKRISTNNSGKFYAVLPKKNKFKRFEVYAKGFKYTRKTLTDSSELINKLEEIKLYKQ
jgi:hypothetical protein